MAGCGEGAAVSESARSPSGAWACKTIESLQAEANSHGLRRALGPLHLVLLGIGCILGAGIYVLPGTAAANFAGPAVMLSFVLAGTACALTALCYAELASTMPVSGSSYSYSYAALGEVFAWGLGWILMLEYTLASSTLAVGFSSYLTSLLRDFGIVVPAALATPLVGAAGSPSVNLVAALAVAAVTAVLCAGVRQSAGVNAFLVVVKVAVLAVVITVGVGAIDPGNWRPFVPPHEGEFAFGWPGILRAASILFFAYLGFETVSTAASESRNPQRDLPIGILGALVVCTALYLAVAAVLTGVVPYRELGVADPVALAVDRMGRPGVAVFVKVGALMGLASVLLVNAYGQSRITFQMSRDGMLPPLFSRVHERFLTPHRGIVALGAVAAVCAALFPIAMLADLVSLGAGLAFATVAFCTMWLRSRRPDLPRPFRVPLGGFQVGRAWIGWIPAAALLLCIAMILPVLVDIGLQAADGQPLMALFLACYVVAGAALYMMYGRRHSTLRTGGSGA
jgi:APA family basic amino acid/polyamine antiporter